MVIGQLQILRKLVVIVESHGSQDDRVKAFLAENLAKSVRI